MTPVGLPHSETPGSQPATGSPRRFAGRRVLHRLSVPRHPPCALAILPDPFGLFCSPPLSAHNRPAHNHLQKHLPPSRSLLAPPLSKNVGGPKRARTANLLRAKQALSQLSYGPAIAWRVGLSGVEPLTSRLSGVRSNHLSYRPALGAFSENREQHPIVPIPETTGTPERR